MHTKAISEKPVEYPERFPLSNDQIEWDNPCCDYNPPYYVSPIVLREFQKKGAQGWADPEDFKKVAREISSMTSKIEFNTLGHPLNPMGRTGMSGRGLLGSWGPNKAADALLTRLNPTTNKMEALFILRKDRLQWAIPGGMVDSNETGDETAIRELKEETSVAQKFVPQDILYKGYVDDPRNTDNAWMETTVLHKHLEYEASTEFALKAEDDACGVEWKEINEELLDSLYASHRKFVELCIQKT